MGVYIPNMEKPKHCTECYFVCRDQCELQDNSYDYDTFKEQKKHCPLIEIDLVRCKDCKHYGFKETDRGGFPCCTNVIGATPYRMPTDFCSYGERRTDDKTEESRP